MSGSELLYLRFRGFADFVLPNLRRSKSTNHHPVRPSRVLVSRCSCDRKETRTSRSSGRPSEANQSMANAANAPGLLAKPGEISRPASTAPKPADTRQVVDSLSDKAT